MAGVLLVPILQETWLCVVDSVAYRYSKQMSDRDEITVGPRRREAVNAQEPTTDGWIAVHVTNVGLRYLPIINHGAPSHGQSGQPLFVPAEHALAADVELVRSNSQDVVGSALRHAIAIGTPKYDHGDVDGCLEAYQEVANSYRNARGTGVLLTQALGALSSMDCCQTLTHAKAFLLRQVFDEVIDSGDDIGGNFTSAVALADSPGVWRFDPDRVVHSYEQVAQQAADPRIDLTLTLSSKQLS